MSQFLERDGGDMGLQRSPGGFEFGIQGYSYGAPVPSSVTFFLDNTAMVCDQYGRAIRGVVMDGGKVVEFAMSPPEGIRADGEVTPRPQFATHADVVAGLLGERVDVLYEMDHAEDACVKCKGKKVLSVGGRCPACRGTGFRYGMSVAGWPQLTYDQLKKIKRLPATPVDDLVRIGDLDKREGAIRAKAEAGDVRAKELVAAAEEE
jgi:hypothetical protein